MEVLYELVPGACGPHGWGRLGVGWDLRQVGSVKVLLGLAMCCRAGKAPFWLVKPSEAWVRPAVAVGNSLSRWSSGTPTHDVQHLLVEVPHGLGWVSRWLGVPPYGGALPHLWLTDPHVGWWKFRKSWKSPAVAGGVPPYGGALQHWLRESCIACWKSRDHPRKMCKCCRKLEHSRTAFVRDARVPSRALEVCGSAAVPVTWCERLARQ